jgi:hypothetical protein
VSKAGVVRRQGRGIPNDLWDAAITLLGRYTASAICRALGLNPARFKQMRERRGVSVSGRVPRRESGWMTPSAERTHGATACRLTLESTAGTLSVVTAGPGPELVEAACRFVLGALGDGRRP